MFQVPLLYPPCLRHSQDATSDELKDFFETQTGCEVAEVSIARDNARLVTLSINRGKLVRKLEVCAARILQVLGHVLLLLRRCHAFVQLL